MRSRSKACRRALESVAVFLTLSSPGPGARPPRVPSPRPAQSATPPIAGSEKIEHVVWIIQENHSKNHTCATGFTLS